MVRWQEKIDAASLPAEVVVEAKGTHLGNLMVLAGYEDRTVLSNILNNVMPKLRSPSPASFLVRGAPALRRSVVLTARRRRDGL
jgi:hypothetical protein